MNGWFVVNIIIVIVVVAIAQMDVAIVVVIGNWTTTRGTSSQNLVSVPVLYVGTYVPISMYISPCIVLVDVTAAFF